MGHHAKAAPGRSGTGIGGDTRGYRVVVTREEPENGDEVGGRLRGAQAAQAGARRIGTAVCLCWMWSVSPLGFTIELAICVIPGGL